MKARILLLLLLVSSYQLLQAQCEINVSASPTSIVCGQSVVLSAFGSSTGQLVLNEDFNTGGFGPGWSSTPGAVNFSNPCSPGGVDGTPHAWMDNNTSVPRALISDNYDLSAATAGVTICFDMMFATQGNAAPCEGPDEPDEGVYLQYSTDGGTTWVTIHYFDPNGGNDPQLTNWNNWCFAVPAAAITSGTMFQWYQDADSGADYDHWGIDNVQIFMNDINSEVVWLHDGYSYGVGNPGGDNPTPVSPTSTTTYTAQITTGTGQVCTGDIEVVVTPPIFDVNVTATPATICTGDCATISGTANVIQDPGGIETYENNEFSVVASGSASVNINVQGINTNTIYDGLIQNVTINGFNFSGSFFCSSFGGCSCNGSTISFGQTCNLDPSGFTVTLTSPGGCSITLVPAGNATGNYSNTVFVPVGGTTQGGSFPTGGPWAPNETLSNLNGCDPNGVWTLSFDAPGLGVGIGTLSGWSITFDDPPVYQPVCTTWSPTTGLGTPGSVNTTACPTSSTNYTLTVSNCTPGCPTHDEVVALTVNPCGGCVPPNLIISPLDVCSPATVDLNTAIGGGSDPANVSFYASQADAQNAVNPISSVVGASGSYWVRAEDLTDPGCYLEYEIVVTVNGLAITTSVVPENCGASDGQISITASSGSGNYSYSIDGGTTTQTGSTFSGLTANTYNIVVNDLTTGCAATSTENVSNLGGPSIDNIAITDPSCPGMCDGSITATVSGGTPPYTFAWTDGSGSSVGTNSATISGLCAGNYNLEVSDAAGGTTQIFFDDFETGAAGWTLNNVMGAEGADPNYFVVNDNEGGVAPGGCGIANNGNATLHVTSVFNPSGGAAYDAGGLCGFLFCPQTDRQSETPLINTVGQTGLTLNFDYIANGDIPNDQATVWYNDGFGWTQLGAPLFSGTGGCAPQGVWTAFSAALPASCENITNLQIAVRWQNNDDGAGSDPSVAINDIEIVTTSAASCSTTQSMVLTDPLPADASFTLTDFCSGNANSASGIATPGGTFAFNPVPGDGSSINTATGEITNGVVGTTYTVQYTTSGACPVTSTNTVTVNGISYSSVNTDENCGSGDGSIVLSAAGGSGNYNYSIDNGATSQGSGTFNGLNAGAYSILVTDNTTGCTSTGTETINNIGGPVIDNSSSNDPSCSGACDGDLSVTVSGGTTPYSYQWYDGALNPIGTNAASITSLCSGNYSVVVSDASGTCTATTNFVLTDPVGADASFALTDFCVGDPNSATGIVTPGGTFAFNPVPGDGSSINTTTGEITNGVAGTTYTVEYTTTGSCAASSTQTVTVSGISYTAVVSDENCGSADGSIDLSATGGSGNYSYSIDNGTTVQSSGLFTGLTSGIYPVVITDNVSGCQVSGSENVGSIGGPSIDNFTVTDPSCAGVCDGEITVTAVGGTPPYTYQWFDGTGTPIGSNAATITGLCDGNYSVEITDANGGTTTTLNTNTDFENGSGAGCACPTGYNCNNDAGQVFDGNQPVYVPGNLGCVGGTTNYTSSLGAYSGTGYVYFYAGADNISSGPYTFAGGETVELCVMYSGPQGSGASGQNTANSNFSFGVDGAQVGPDVLVPVNTGWTQFCFTVTMTAGNHTFQILSGGAAQYAIWFDDFTINSVSGGGGSSCPANGNFTLTEPVAADPSFALADFCAGDANNASSVVTPGGTFAYNPNPGDGSSVDPSTGEISNGIPGTTYTIEYTTPGTCPVTSTNTVTVNGFTYSATLTDESCSAANGSIALATNGGGPNFDFSIDNGATTQSTGSFSNLVAGNYDVLIVDQATGCTASGLEIISNTTPPQIDVINVVDETCMGLNNGSIDVATVSGGTGNYNYSWDIVPDPATAQVTSLAPGTYTVTVTDAVSGCSTSSTQTVNAGINCCDLAVDQLSSTNVNCNGGSDGTVNVTYTGGTGTITFEITDGTYTDNNTTGNFTGLSAGTYTVTLTDVNGCSDQDQVVISEPAQVDFTFVQTDITCYGGSDGSLTFTAMGGTAPYQYSVDNGVTWSNNANQLNLVAGSYDLLVQDVAGCQSASLNIQIDEPTEIMVNAVTTDESCYNQCDGQVEFNVSGGTGNYLYQVNNTNSTATVNNLCGGTFSYNVQDDNGCIVSGSFNIIPAVQITIDNMTVIDDDCSNSCIGEIYVSSSTAVNYTLGAVTNPSGVFTGLCSDNYAITLTDANGCSISTSAIVGSGTPAIANFAVLPGYVTTMDSEFQVINNSSNSDSYQWEINGPDNFTYSDGNEDFSLELPPVPGAYTVCLIANNSAGCPDTTCQSVIVKDEFLLFVPNAFTPNGDEYNNSLQVYATGIDRYGYNMQIYDRWGELIWETNDISVFWDGTYQGKVVQSGTYTWKIVIKDPYTDERRDFVGHVNVLK